MLNGSAERNETTVLTRECHDPFGRSSEREHVWQETCRWSICVYLCFVH